MEEGEVLRILS